jgi:outer membrane protein assembly factor BamA
MGARQLRAALILALVATLGPGRIARGDWSFIPIPEIITDPNEGNTFGFLGVVLILDEKDEIKYMLAPDVRYNETKGVYPTVRWFGYPTPLRRYSVVLGKSTTKDEDYELEFSDRSYWEGRAFVIASFIHDKDSTERFYGFGNDSLEERESNYTSDETAALVSPGVWLLPNANLSYRMLVRRFGVQTGQVAERGDCPDGREDRICLIQERRFPGRQPDLDTTVHWAHQVALTYDSRDEIDIPTRGALALMYLEAADELLGSSTSYVKFGTEWRDFIPLRRGNPILALRALLDYTSGDRDTPFWAQSSLGGRRTLRGFGSDRFIDFNRSLASAELRTRVWQRRMFGVKAELELAPFVETGQVFRKVLESPVSDLHFVYGLGFRGVVRPQIVGFVDIGVGAEGSAIFTGINYPF